MDGLDFVQTYINDLLCLTKGSFEDHLECLELVFCRLRDAGLKVNARKSFFVQPELEYLGYWITQQGIQPLKDKVAVIMKIDPSNVNRWVHESRDPSAEAVFELKKALQSIDPAAAEDFVMKYLYDEN